MFGLVSKKSYIKIATRLDNANIELEDKKIVIEKLREENEKLKTQLVEQEYRENINAKERLELNNVITNLIQEKNELNAKLIQKSKRGRKPKEAKNE